MSPAAGALVERVRAALGRGVWPPIEGFGALAAEGGDATEAAMLTRMYADAIGGASMSQRLLEVATQHARSLD